jgi:hypothetical protein
VKEKLRRHLDAIPSLTYAKRNARWILTDEPKGKKIFEKIETG